MEHGSVDVHVRPAPARTDFELPAALRLQCVVEACVAIGPVGQFVQRGRLEAAPRAGVQGEPGLQLPAQAEHRVHEVEFQRAGVVAVRQIAVGGIETNVAAAQPGGEAEAVGETHLGLREQVARLHGVGLVAALIAGHTQHLARAGAGEVLEAAALVALLFERHPGDQVDATPSPGQARVDTAVAAVEINHPTAVLGAGLRGRRNRQPLRHAARAGIGGDRAFAQRAAAFKGVLPARADLALARRLAGVEGGGLRRGLARVGIELSAAQRQRVVGSLRDVARDHGDAVACVVPAQPDVAELAPGLGVRPEADGFELRDLGFHIQRVVQRRLHAEANLAQPEAAHVHIESGAALFRRHAEQRNHAARAVAIEHRERPAQHLDALRAGQVEVGDLALAIRHGGRDAVGVKAQAAHAETGACAEAA